MSLARPLGQRGFTVTEVMIVIAIIGVMAVVAIPTLVNYTRAASLTGAAENLVAGLNSARQLAITQNRNVCVELAAPNQYRFWLGACGAGTVWSGPGAGANGFYIVSDNMTVVTTANPVFNRLGAAPTTATFTITDPVGMTRNVVVAASGRVTK